MYRRSPRRVHQRTNSQRGPFAFLRKPAVQLTILGVAAVAVILIPLTAGK